MKFTVHRDKKECLIPSSALAVAGLKKEKELRLEVESGVVVVLRPEMNTQRLLSVGEFLHSLADRMIEAVALECGDCLCCGDCLDDGDEDCECDHCQSREECRGISIPDCLLKQAGIGTDCGLQADVEDGIVIIQALPGGEDDSSANGIPESARLVFAKDGVCISHLRELLYGNKPIKY
ncbi:hypothetical protein LJC63_01985 [Ruminococcaceae bacterium OttesenSCG-928-L11]|nr:hypothetical protein [Ruminococcaceae bacterium OttesenSCG-928-L11]